MTIIRWPIASGTCEKTVRKNDEQFHCAKSRRETSNLTNRSGAPRGNRNAVKTGRRTQALHELRAEARLQVSRLKMLIAMVKAPLQDCGQQITERRI